MFPASQGLNLDVEAISGICGSISIACWVVVFSPQIIENFRRKSADGLSLQFIIIWLAGDVFNVWGAILQGVLPTMVILAVYYTIADIVLLGQCFYYRGFTWRDDVSPSKPVSDEPTEQTGLIHHNGNGAGVERERRPSNWSSIDATHLSPATPLLHPSTLPPSTTSYQNSQFQTAIFNLFAILMVCAAGFLGWWLSNRCPKGKEQKHAHNKDDVLALNLWGQIFGYLCALLYLGSRLPQILLNYRRKSTDGLSGLFFLFACIGNVTYSVSIFAFEAKCHGKHGKCADGEASRIYGQYILLNASWILGSLGCLFLDFAILIQFLLYSPKDDASLNDEEVVVGGSSRQNSQGNGNGRAFDNRPLLARGDTDA